MANVISTVLPILMVVTTIIMMEVVVTIIIILDNDRSYDPNIILCDNHKLLNIIILVIELFIFFNTFVLRAIERIRSPSQLNLNKGHNFKL